MKIVTLGAGGVGSVIAGHLAKFGVDVVMIARASHCQASSNPIIQGKIQGVNQEWHLLKS